MSCKILKYYWPEQFDTNNFFTIKTSHPLVNAVRKLQFCNSCGKSHLLHRHIFWIARFSSEDVPYQFFVVSCNRGSQQISSMKAMCSLSTSYIFLWWCVDWENRTFCPYYNQMNTQRRDVVRIAGLKVYWDIVLWIQLFYVR